MSARSPAPLVAYRIGWPSHPLLDGAGAAASDSARWNSRGRHVIYAAEHYATALLEKSAQLNSLRLPRGLAFIRIEVLAGTPAEEVRPHDLPGWDDDDRSASQRFGDRWYDEQRSVILLVPSLGAPGIERNVLINERHPQFARTVSAGPAEPIRCHPRLMA